MQIARVIGTVTSTLKHPAYEGKKLLLVAFTGPDGVPSGGTAIGVDMVQAGVGDLVLLNKEGNATRQVLGKNAGPVLELILGIIDHVDRSEG